MRESEDLIGEATQTVTDAVENCLAENITDWTRIKADVKDVLSDFVWKRTQRRPMILPIIMEASV